MWQEVIVGVCVIAAAFFLARRWIFPPTKKAAGCGGCGGCDKTSTSSCSNPDDKITH
jgi:hypothetical protein